MKCLRILCVFLRVMFELDIRKCEVGFKIFFVLGKEICGKLDN